MQNYGFILEPKLLYKNGELSDEELSLLKDELEMLFNPRLDTTDLTNEQKICAEKELNEKPDRLRANINELKRLISEDKTINPRTDDLFLAAFLRGRKHDVQRAFQCLKGYYEYKHKYPELLNYVYPSKNPEVYDQNYFGNLASLDKKGRKICVLIIARMNIDQIPVSDSFRLGISMIEMMLNDIVQQVSGTAMIFDFDNVSLSMQTRIITPRFVWHLALIIQDKVPIRIKAIHIVNQPFYYKAAYALIKPFLKKKMRNRFFLHGNDMESLHQHIDPESLPSEYGGTKDSFSIKLTRTLLHLNEHKFEEWEKYSWIG